VLGENHGCHNAKECGRVPIRIDRLS